MAFSLPSVDRYLLCPKADMLGPTLNIPYWVSSLNPNSCIEDCNNWKIKKNQTCHGILFEIDHAKKGAYCYIKGSSSLKNVGSSEWCMKRGFECNVYLQTNNSSITCPSQPLNEDDDCETEDSGTKDKTFTQVAVSATLRILQNHGSSVGNSLFNSVIIGLLLLGE